MDKAIASAGKVIEAIELSYNSGDYDLGEYRSQLSEALLTTRRWIRHLRGDRLGHHGSNAVQVCIAIAWWPESKQVASDGRVLCQGLPDPCACILPCLKRCSSRGVQGKRIPFSLVMSQLLE